MLALPLVRAAGSERNATHACGARHYTWVLRYRLLVRVQSCELLFNPLYKLKGEPMDDAPETMLLRIVFPIPEIAPVNCLVTRETLNQMMADWQQHHNQSTAAAMSVGYGVRHESEPQVYSVMTPDYNEPRVLLLRWSDVLYVG